MKEDKTLTRLTLISALRKDIKIPRQLVADVVNDVFETITEVLDEGKTVKVPTFGSFVVKQKRERVGRNPRTGKEVTIAPRRVVTFKPSIILKDKVLNK